MNAKHWTINLSDTCNVLRRRNIIALMHVILSILYTTYNIHSGIGYNTCRLGLSKRNEHIRKWKLSHTKLRTYAQCLIMIGILLYMLVICTQCLYNVHIIVLYAWYYEYKRQQIQSFRIISFRLSLTIFITINSSQFPF